MDEFFSRTAALVGADGIQRLRRARVLVFGAGGVGGYVIEALARAGIGTIGICDGDTVAASNLNRQIFATVETIGMQKTAAARARVLSVNPSVNVRVYEGYYLPETAGAFDLTAYDHIVDAIDSVRDKTELIANAAALSVPIVSCMGTGNKLDPSQFRIADIYATSVCPLAKVMRSELKKRGVKNLTVVYSTEPPGTPWTEETAQAPLTNENPPARTKRRPPASISFVPAAAAMILTGHVVRTILEK